MFNKLCIVEIKGGFGNQLFQYNFASYLKSSGYKVKVNTSFYQTLVTQSEITNRYQVLNEKIFGFKKTSKVENFILDKLRKINDSKKIIRIFPNFKNSIYRYFKDDDFKKNTDLNRISHFDGYWQDKDYIEDQGKFLKDSLKKVPILQNAMSEEISENSFLIIVRRGDYLKMQQDLSDNYYSKCFENIQKISNNPEINIFTDDINWVRNNSIFDSATMVYGPEDEPEKVLELFSMMLRNKHYFVGNSTFSFFAALLGKKSDSKIFVANPWFRNRKTKNLIYEEWFKIDNT
jgi:hypothetical protein